MNELRLFDDLMDFDPLDLPLRGLARPWRLEPGTPQAPTMRVDISEDGQAYALKADIPGVRKEDIEVRIDGRQVTLSAETKFEKEERGQGGRLLRSERRSGFARRSFTLDHPVDEAKAQAHYRDGVLELRLPKRAGEGTGHKVAIAG